jgi:hypothetical protein
MSNLCKIGSGKKEKEAKKKETKEGEACGNCHSHGNRTRWPSAIIRLMISTAVWKTLLGFPQLPQARRRLINQPGF